MEDNDYNARIKKAIEGFKKENEKNALYVAVAEDILNEEHEDIVRHIKDILEHGCISGIVNSMIYYKDTKEFFQKYYDEIFTIIKMNMYSYKTAEINSNSLAWYGYEQSVWSIYNYLQEHENIV